jgi:hypothetical protein
VQQQIQYDWSDWKYAKCKSFQKGTGQMSKIKQATSDNDAYVARYKAWWQLIYRQRIQLILINGTKTGRKFPKKLDNTATQN